MEILLQSYKIKSGVREWLQEEFLKNITWLALIKSTEQKNIITEHVCGIEIKGQKSNTQQTYNKSNYKLPILKDFVNKAIEQQKNKNVRPRSMRGENSLIKSQSMPDLF